MSDGNTIRSVAKAMELLGTLSDAPLSLTALSEKTGWPKSTVFGLLTTMREYGVISQREDGKYFLGLRLFELGCSVIRSWDISAAARPYMEHLAAQTGASVVLSIRDGDHVVTVEQAEGHGDLRIVSDIGSRLPLHCTSQGKLFLSSLKASEVARVLSSLDLTPYTPHTLVSAEELEAELGRIRENGFAIENGEYKIGLRSVSAPVRDVSGEMRYALGAIGMFRKIQSEEFQQAIVQVTATAKMISKALGFQK